MVPPRQQGQPRSAAPVARRAHAARGGGHHHAGVPQNGEDGWRGLLGGLSAQPGRRARRHHGDGAAVRAQPGERRPRRMAGAGHAQGQAASAFEKPAAAPAQPLRAAARKRPAPGRAVQHAGKVWSGQPHRRAAQAGARRDLTGCEARGLQARHAERASVHELPHHRRKRSPDGPGP
ncbi:hypothetical protein SDC9_91617 [bioreactor metagenome]|uniref:Uncharacterized protein n=1 Tax=bioreactor metagenome TaxID=1076179 RepID=A0A644ZVI4_9ZZZZ